MKTFVKKVESQHGTKFPRNFSQNRWFTSAKTNLGINEAIDFLLDNILNSSGIETKSEKEEVLVDLSRPKAAKKEEDSCPC